MTYTMTADERKRLARRARLRRLSSATLRATLNEIKAAGCADCGVVPDNLANLHFHHLDPATMLFRVSQTGVYHSPAERSAEIAKCVVVCQPCHVMRHRVIRFFEDEGTVTVGQAQRAENRALERLVTRNEGLELLLARLRGEFDMLTWPGR